MNKLKKPFATLANLGISPQVKIEEAQRIRLTNLLGSSPAFIFLYYIYYGFAHHFYFLPAICGFMLIGIVAGLYSNYRKRPVLAKAILFSVDSLSIFLTFNFVNVDYSVTCYFFPLVIAYVMIYDIRKEWYPFLLTFTFTILCALSCFLLPKYLLGEFDMTEKLAKTVTLLNFIFPFLLSVLIVFIIIKTISRTQEKLIRAREDSEMANKAKSDFLSNMSHELRTPLNGIIGSVNLLMNEPATLSQKKYYEILQHSSDLMLGLINHILDFSKIKEGKTHLDRNVFNLNQMLSRLGRVFEAQNTEGDVRFIYEIDPLLDKEFISDDLRLHQILVNLLANAKKFTKKGSIHFTASVVNQTDQRYSIRFSVKDSGIGIKPEKLEKIFESFVQADNSTTRIFGGTGLGLSICKELTQLFHSQLHVTSTYGEGSEFYFTITAEINAESPAIADTGMANIKELKGLRLLVAEDNNVNMLVLRTFLRKWQVTFDEVTNGVDALVRFEKNEYDIILLDIEMPVMDGYTAIREIRKKDTEIPVIAFTAAFYDDMKNDLTTRGFNDHIHKPFKPNDLYSKISRYRRCS